MAQKWSETLLNSHEKKLQQSSLLMSLMQLELKDLTQKNQEIEKSKEQCLSFSISLTDLTKM